MGSKYYETPNVDRIYFETICGQCSALICAIDLPNLQKHPEARQLYYSMLKYVKSEEFSPTKELNKQLLNRIIH